METKIETWLNNPILRKISEIVETKEIKKIDKVLRDYLVSKKDEWVWLAAPQLGINKRIFLCKFDKKNVSTIVNPEILYFSDETEVHQEWCLSLPWVWWEVERPIMIQVRYQDIKWKEKILNLKDFPARVFQHEFDHLNWVLFYDKVIWDLQIDEGTDLKGLWIN